MRPLAAGPSAPPRGLLRLSQIIHGAALGCAVRRSAQQGPSVTGWNLGRSQLAIIFLVTQTIAEVPVRLRARFFGGLADPARLALLEALRHGELAAGDAAVAAGLSVSNASKHLACLRECGLVDSRQEWRRVYYRLAEGIPQMLDANDAFIARVADRIAACERPEMKTY